MAFHCGGVVVVDFTGQTWEWFIASPGCSWDAEVEYGQIQTARTKGDTAL